MSDDVPESKFLVNDGLKKMGNLDRDESSDPGSETYGFLASVSSKNDLCDLVDKDMQRRAERGDEIPSSFAPKRTSITKVPSFVAWACDEEDDELGIFTESFSNLELNRCNKAASRSDLRLGEEVLENAISRRIKAADDKYTDASRLMVLQVRQTEGLSKCTEYTPSKDLVQRQQEKCDNENKEDDGRVSGLQSSAARIRTSSMGSVDGLINPTIKEISHKDVLDSINRQQVLAKTIGKKEWQNVFNHLGDKSKPYVCNSELCYIYLNTFGSTLIVISKSLTKSLTHIYRYISSTTLLPPQGCGMRLYGSISEFHGGLLWDSEKLQDQLNSEKCYKWPSGYYAKSEFNVCRQSGELKNKRSDHLVDMDRLRKDNEAFYQKSQKSSCKAAPFNEVMVELNAKSLCGIFSRSLEYQHLLFVLGVRDSLRRFGLRLPIFVMEKGG